MKYLHNPHTGEILLTEFMEPFELTNYRLAKDLNIPESRIGKIVKGERRITTDTALRLEMYFGLKFGKIRQIDIKTNSVLTS